MSCVTMKLCKLLYIKGDLSCGQRIPQFMIYVWIRLSTFFVEKKHDIQKYFVFGCIRKSNALKIYFNLANFDRHVKCGILLEKVTELWKSFP